MTISHICKCIIALWILFTYIPLDFYPLGPIESLEKLKAYYVDLVNLSTQKSLSEFDILKKYQKYSFLLP